MDEGSPFGLVRRVAVAVSRSTGGTSLGVVQVGAQIGAETTALHTLLVLLLIAGILVLLAAALGGLFLSGRALKPVRLAFERQQTFIADASHELRTPLTLLRADAEVLLRGRDRLRPEDAELLEDIVAETAHMSSLATSMLALARLDAGRMHLEREVLDLARLAITMGRRVRALAQRRTSAWR